MAADFKLTARLERLRSALEKEFASLKRHMLLSDDEQGAFANIANSSYAETHGMPEILRCSAFLAKFADEFPVSIRRDELIVGSQRFAHPDWGRYLSEERRKAGGSHSNLGHIAVDYGRMLRDGIPGTRRTISAMKDGDNKKAFAQALAAFSKFISRHAEACRSAGLDDIGAACANVEERRPATFHEALQMVWFIQIFLHAEGNSAAISFGRFDQYMWPFLKKDLEDGVITEGAALELLCAFFMKCCEGDESQNLVVGGAGSEHPENPLSILVLKAARAIRVWQPSISVRIAKGSSEELWEESLRLAVSGTGMPSFFNEPVVTAGLKRLGIPAGRAADWAIVGCYEAAPQGDSYPLTVGGGFALPSLLWDYTRSGGLAADSFEAFYAGFKKFLRSEYEEKILPSFIERWKALEQNCPSPFESICVTGCIRNARAAEEGGAKYNLFGVNILGIGTLVDSLLSIRTLVFEEGSLTAAQLCEQLEKDFPDRSLLLRCRTMEGKFGSDSPAANFMARDLSSFIAHAVISKPFPNGVRPYPGFFWFGVDIGIRLPASADGRKADDRISYGCGPGIFLKNPTATSILNSAARLDHSSCACGNPLTLSLARRDVEGRRGMQRLRQLVEAYFRNGGFHLQFNIVGPEEMRRAKKEPDKYQGLTVRISGYSARFVTLAPRWQDALIERAEKGM